MTSASSKTNTLMADIAIALNFIHQSRRVPGVPTTICSLTFSPRATTTKIAHMLSLDKVSSITTQFGEHDNFEFEFSAIIMHTE